MSDAHASREPTDGPDLMPEGPWIAKPYRDLCSTCSHSATCGHRSTPERPILFCELFEVVASPVAVTPTDTPKPRDRQYAGDLQGLCRNCENGPTCTLPKPEGGVWHCEEYR